MTDVLTALVNRELAGTLGFGTYSSITEFHPLSSIAGIGDFGLLVQIIQMDLLMV
ncbi:MAG: hypothetical protein IPN54_07310 [Bacteroidetes bacterium]|nr:hypothetical protein [Bacteroidota bacterium]